MQTAAATVQARFDSDAPGAKEALERLRESGREAMTEMEAMLDSLRATALTNAGLVEALKKQGEALQFRTGARVVFDIGALPPDAALAPGAQQAVFRVAQEAFANIGRHARAANVRVSLAPEADRLVLRVEDDGAGFSASTPVGGMGLANMRERAAAVDARFDVRSEPGSGTAVTLAVPYAAWSRGDIGGYRVRLIGWACVVLFNAAIVLGAGLKGARIGTTAALLIANGIIFVQAAVAYGRARKRAEDASWIESPSRS
jgi:signal transduction histidine kinase